MGKFTRLDERLHAYLAEHRSPDDPLLQELRRETREKLGGRALMQIAPEQGTFLSLLVGALGARRVVEVGTFTGYSALCMARALPADGHLHAFDSSEEWTSMARRYWERAGVADRITLHLGPAAETLPLLSRDEPIDLAFIDADKVAYRLYYEEIMSRLRPGGLVCVDNVLWGGAVIDRRDDSAATRAIRAFNDFVARDERVEAVMIPLSDGLSLVRKRTSREKAARRDS